MKKIKLDNNIVKSLRKFMVDNNINDYSYEVDKFEIKILNPKEYKGVFMPKNLAFIVIIGIIAIASNFQLESIKIIDRWVIPIYIGIIYMIWKIIGFVYSDKIYKEKKVWSSVEKSRKDDYYNSDEKHNLR